MNSGTVGASAAALLWASAVAITFRKTQNKTWRVLNASIFALTLGNVAVAYGWGARWTGSLAFAIIGIAEVLRLRRQTTQELASGTLSAKALVIGLLAVGYFLTVATLPVVWIRWHEPAAQWIAGGIAFESLAFGVPIAIGVWWFAFRPSAKRAVSGKMERFKRGSFLFALAFVPAFAIFAVPSLCLGVLPEPMNGIVMWSWMGLVVAIFLGGLAWAKYYWKPRHPEAFARYAQARGLPLDRVNETSDQQA